MQTYRCPHCQHEIPLADVNVAADIALCRQCGASTAFSRLSGAAELSPAQLDQPMKGVTITQSMIGGTEILYHRVSKMVFFFIPFMLVWSGGALGGIYGDLFRRGQFDVAKAMFGLPFLIGTLVMLCVIVFMLFGKWRVRLNGGQGEVFVGVGPAGWTRRFACGRDSMVSLELTATQRNNVPQRAISVQTGGSGIKFGALLPEEVKRYIGAAIARECATT